MRACRAGRWYLSFCYMWVRQPVGRPGGVRSLYRFRFSFPSARSRSVMWRVIDDMLLAVLVSRYRVGFCILHFAVGVGHLVLLWFNP